MKFNFIFKIIYKSIILVVRFKVIIMLIIPNFFLIVHIQDILVKVNAVN